MSATITQSQTTNTYLYQLTLPATQATFLKDDYEKAREKLAEIILRYETWKDSLSTQLLEWGVKVLAADPPDSIETNQEFAEEAKKQIDLLLNKILVNPLDKAPLVDPVLVRNQIWEKWMLDDYLATFPGSEKLSPFDYQPITEIKPHSYAQEILDWANEISKHFSTKSVSTSTASSSSMALSPFSSFASLMTGQTIQNPHQLNREIISAPASKETQAQKLFHYCNLAQQATTLAFEEKLTDVIKQQSMALTKIWNDTKEMVRLREEEIKLASSLHLMQLNHRIDEKDKIQRTTLDALHSNIEVLKMEHQVTKNKLQSTQDICNQQQSQIQHLLHCYHQTINQIEQLENRNSGKSKSCIIQ